MLVKIFNSIKVLLVVIIFLMLWKRQADLREIKLDVIHELSAQNYLNMTFHHDVYFANGSYNTSGVDSPDRKLSPQAEAHEQIIKRVAKENWPNITTGYKV